MASETQPVPMVKLTVAEVLEFISWQMSRETTRAKETKTRQEREDAMKRWVQWTELYHLVEDHGEAATVSGRNRGVPQEADHE